VKRISKTGMMNAKAARTHSTSLRASCAAPYQ
jgi:hypothetical protein